MVGARERLNGRENMARRKVKNGEKSPWISEDASVYDNLGEYNQAKELHEKALTISKKIFGEDHANVATLSLINI